MNRRGFLKFAAAAPVLAPMAAAAAAPVAPALASRGWLSVSGAPLHGSSFWVGSNEEIRWLNLTSFSSPEPTMAESIAEHASEMLDAAKSVGNFGAVAEKMVSRVADAVAGSVANLLAIAAPDPAVQTQMDDHDLFESRSIPCGASTSESSARSASPSSQSFSISPGSTASASVMCEGRVG